MIMQAALAAIVGAWSGLVGLAAAQSPPSDPEIANAYATCIQGDHKFPPPMPSRAPSPDAGRYKLGWEFCESIEAEYQKRQLAAKARDAADQQRIKSIIERLPK
jgi:hypothetical protein